MHKPYFYKLLKIIIAGIIIGIICGLISSFFTSFALIIALASGIASGLSLARINTSSIKPTSGHTASEAKLKPAD